MRPSEVSEVVRSFVRNRKMPSLHIWGPPGIGKSKICEQIAVEEDIGFIDMRLSMKDPTDIKGLPAPENGRAKWLPPSELPREGKGLLFLDELNLAPPLVQASAYQLILDRKVGEYVLPEGWQVMAAGNKSEHGANVFKMAAPLRNRFIHIDFEVDVDDWREWAIKNELASEVIEFISFKSDMLYSFKPDRNENAFPTPRTWEFVSKIIQNGQDMGPEVMHKTIEGAVGTGAAIDFKSYLRIKSELPKTEDILAGKDYYSGKIDVACALITSLVIRARNDQFERLLNYSQDRRMEEEVAVLMLRLMANKNKRALLDCPSWRTLAKKYADLLTSSKSE